MASLLIDVRNLCLTFWILLYFFCNAWSFWLNSDWSYQIAILMG